MTCHPEELFSKRVVVLEEKWKRKNEWEKGSIVKENIKGRAHYIGFLNDFTVRLK